MFLYLVIELVNTFQQMDMNGLGSYFSNPIFDVNSKENIENLKK